jgi:adenine deaminase
MNEDVKTVSGNIVDVLKAEIYPGTLVICNGRIADVKREIEAYGTFIIPGFIDSHVHLESSMLVPSEFARIALIHGTVASVSDPHEIANVLGVAGINFMIENSKTVPMKFYLGAPSSVPATDFETSGAVLGPGEIEQLLRMAEIKYLAEVMNVPGVINGDPDIYEKIRIAKKYSKVIDGHAPGLRGKDLDIYIKAGVSTDHESFTKEEALEKISLGMKIIIREGSAAKNLDELVPLIDDNYKNCMFCSDDKHPDDLLKGHINEMVKKALAYGIDLMKVLRVACVNPVLHYGLDAGMLRKGDNADFLVINNLKELNVLKTYINGKVVAEEGKSCLVNQPPRIVNNFHAAEKSVSDFILPASNAKINVIEAIDGQLITGRAIENTLVVNGNAVSDPDRDILKIAVINRYKESEVMIGFIKNIGLKNGAIASSIAHDSHNIIAIGVTEEAICRAVNLIIKTKGGISAVNNNREELLPLPVAGIMSDRDYTEVAEKYQKINNMAKQLGSTLHAPFMTLSFMALPVIPEIKLTDKGLFDSEQFRFIDVFEE